MIDCNQQFHPIQVCIMDLLIAQYKLHRGSPRGFSFQLFGLFGLLSLFGCRGLAKQQDVFCGGAFGTSIPPNTTYTIPPWWCGKDPPNWVSDLLEGSSVSGDLYGLAV